MALTPSLHKDVATFFYTFRHYATVDRNDGGEIARRIIRACTPAVYSVVVESFSNPCPIVKLLEACF